MSMVSQVLLAGGQVFFPGDLSFSPLGSAQNELNNLDGPKIPNKTNLEPVLGLTDVSVVQAYGLVWFYRCNVSSKWENHKLYSKTVYSATVPCSTILLCLHYDFASWHVQLVWCRIHTCEILVCMLVKWTVSLFDIIFTLWHMWNACVSMRGSK